MTTRSHAATPLRRFATTLALLPLALAATPPGCEPPPAAPPSFDPGYAARQQEFLDFAVAETGTGGINTQVARLVRGIPVQDGPILSGLEKIRNRPDTSDFTAVQLIRLLYLSDEIPGLDSGLKAEIEQTLIDFKYWVDEPGVDPMIFWSENHQILFAAAEYLMGQRFPATVFPNAGLTGAEHVAKARARILAWTRDRERFGYSEWLSNTYYEEDAAPLLALVDFANDPEIVARATISLDLLAYDMALNSLDGFFTTTHGRTPGVGSKFDARSEATASMQRLLFGQGIFRSRNDWAGVAYATGDYRPPRVISEIARDDSTFVTRQRQSIYVEEAPRYGYRLRATGDAEADLRSAIFLWGMGGYPDYRVAPLTMEIAETYELFDPDSVFAPFAFLAGLPPALISTVAYLAAPIAEGALYERVNVHTYRMAEGMLSSAQDKMKGTFAFQQHAWQASFGPKANVFTTHPGPEEDAGLPFEASYWGGGSSMPRVGQHESAAIILYDPRVETMLGGLLADFFPDFTHAYFPRAEFDEVVTLGQWTFGRKGTGYVALYSAIPATWTTEGEWADRELIAPGSRNAWICEIGNAARFGSFEAFQSAIKAARIEVADPGQRVLYESPGVGRMELGWEGPLVVDGVERPLDDYPRYSNPFGHTPWGASRLDVTRGDASLSIDFRTGARTGS